MGLGLPVSILGFKPQMGLGSFLGFKTNWFMYSRLLNLAMGYVNFYLLCIKYD
jgi:hypothetical protein